MIIDIPKPAIIIPAPKELSKPFSREIILPNRRGKAMLPGLIPFMPTANAFILEKVGDDIADDQNIPSTALPGDLYVFFNFARNNTGGGIPSDVIPTGFTGITTAGFGVRRIRASYRIIQSGDAGDLISPVMSGTGNAFSSGLLFRFKNGVPITSVTIQDINQQGTSGDPTAQVKNASGGTPPLIINSQHMTINADNHTWSPGFDGTIDGTTLAGPGTSTASTSNISCWKIYQATDTPSDHTVDSPDTGTENLLISWYLEIGT